MLVQVALNGSRSWREHPALPITPDQVAQEAARSVTAGARAIHLHVRGSDGRESLAPDDVAQTVCAVRAVCPATPIGLSTSATIVADVAERSHLVAAWTVVPDFVSVNLHEAGAFDLIDLLLHRGIGIEAGLWSSDAAHRLIACGLADRCLRILIEAFEDEPTRAVQTANQIEAILNAGTIQCPRLLHGENTAAWLLVEEAFRRGYATRVGFEDMLALPDGTQAASNATLVALAVQMRTKSYQTRERYQW